MAHDPRVHGDCGRCAGVNRPSRAKLGDFEHNLRGRNRSFAKTRAFLAKQQNAVFGQLVGFDWFASGDVVNGNDRQTLGLGPSYEIFDSGMVAHVLVTIGDHRPATVPTFVPDDVHLGRQEGVSCSHD